MSESSQPVAEYQGNSELVFGAPAFYVVSRKKFALLYLATLGVYNIYWFYKNWSNYKNRASNKRSIWPVPRAIFSVFFIHDLFREIKVHGYNKNTLAVWNNGLQATTLMITMMFSHALDRMSYRSIGSPYTDLASLLILAPLLTLFLNAQHMINASCGDPEGESNSRLTTANYVWIVLGVIIWILITIGLFLPDNQ